MVCVGCWPAAAKLWSSSTGGATGAQRDEQGCVCIQLWQHQAAFAQATWPVQLYPQSKRLSYAGGGSTKLSKSKSSVSSAVLQLSLLTPSPRFLSSEELTATSSDVTRA